MDLEIVAREVDTIIANLLSRDTLVPPIAETRVYRCVSVGGLVEFVERRIFSFPYLHRFHASI